MLIKDDLDRACQAIGFLTTEIDRGMRASRSREAATRQALELLEIRTRRQRPPLRLVEDGPGDERR